MINLKLEKSSVHILETTTSFILFLFTHTQKELTNYSFILHALNNTLQKTTKKMAI